ncbi:PCNA-associated factor [Cinara cedri]|uniref:PCNA-associated factor n=1 Tax=Cinara cedri TaxID=506608 RepID=A0A5E4MHC1_9HEMI|nr:PCNA-associated factor [Cinara cedri]
MVRTKNTALHTVSLGRSPKMQASCKAACRAASSLASSSSTSTPNKKRNYSGGGNPVHKRETPLWQKEITCFFPAKNDKQSTTDEDYVPPKQQMTQAGSSRIQ